jgi:DNA-directed RNA polymerase subunit RPC12/RpoP
MIKIEYICDNCGEFKPYIPTKASVIVCEKCGQKEWIPNPKPIENKEE